MSLYTFLQDRKFLNQLNSLKIKEQFVKITVLNWKEEPLQQIQGIAINGSVNLDGSSSMRRTATLTLFAEEKENYLDNVDHLFSVNKKCIIELGIVNKVPNYIYQYKNQDDNIKINTINYQQLYGDIVWFPLGVYVMFNPSVSHGMDGVSISMQLKDKMCLLNGDLGGQIHSSVDFAYQDEMVDIDTNSIEKNPVLIYNIIKQLVNHWGNERLDKIIISEVPLQIKRVIKWNGKEPIFLIQTKNSWLLKPAAEIPEIPKDDIISEPIEYNFGQDIGFVFDDFTYPGELVCNAGDSITNILDKIIGVMGNYQYFYDVFGNFIFREKQNYLNMTNTAYWAKEQVDKLGNPPKDIYDADYYRLTKPIYDFSGNEYVTAHNNTLNYNNLKNDFVVWGTRKSTNNTNIPCRFHLAIDKKPDINQIHNNIMFYKDSNQVIRAKALSNEILYSKNKIKINATDNILFSSSVIDIYNNGYAILKINCSSLDQGMLQWNAFLQEYIDDIIINWKVQYNLQYIFIIINKKFYTNNYGMINPIRDKIDFIPVQIKEIKEENSQEYKIVSYSFLPWYFNDTYQKEKNNDEIIQYGKTNSQLYPKNVISIHPIISKDWRQQIYYQMLESEKLGTDQNTELNNSYFQYYAELKEEFPKIYDLQKQEYKQSPIDINYFLDFIDENSSLGGYSVSNIGRRSMIIEDNNEGINCVFEPQIPDLVYIDTSKYSEEEMRAMRIRLSNISQDWIQIDSYLSPLLKTGGVYNSCFEKIKDLIYQYTHINNTISITGLPIYYLEPNTRITVEDKPSGISGDYIIQSISLPLDVSSTMTINAYEAEQKI